MSYVGFLANAKKSLCVSVVSMTFDPAYADKRSYISCRSKTWWCKVLLWKLSSLCSLNYWNVPAGGPAIDRAATELHPDASNHARTYVLEVCNEMGQRGCWAPMVKVAGLARKHQNQCPPGLIIRSHSGSALIGLATCSRQLEDRGNSYESSMTADKSEASSTNCILFFDPVKLRWRPAVMFASQEGLRKTFTPSRSVIAWRGA